MRDEHEGWFGLYKLYLLFFINCLYKLILHSYLVSLIAVEAGDLRNVHLADIAPYSG